MSAPASIRTAATVLLGQRRPVLHVRIDRVLMFPGHDADERPQTFEGRAGNTDLLDVRNHVVLHRSRTTADFDRPDDRASLRMRASVSGSRRKLNGMTYNIVGQWTLRSKCSWKLSWHASRALHTSIRRQH